MKTGWAEFYTLPMTFAPMVTPVIRQCFVAKRDIIRWASPKQVSFLDLVAEEEVGEICRVNRICLV